MGADTHEIDINRLLQTMLERKACDLHLTHDSPPAIRLNGELYPLRTRALVGHDIHRLAASLLSEEQMAHFEQAQVFSMAFGWKGTHRFRATFFRQKESTACAIRMISTELKSLEELGFPPSVNGLFASPTGLIVVAGAAASGRSTTLTSMLDLLNTQHRQHIVTVEAPIEYMHSHKRALFSQREVGADTLDFASSLQSVRMQDPDTIFVSEVPDLGTMAPMLTLAETGKPVLTALPGNTAVDTLLRILSYFPVEQREHACQQLGGCLSAVICQQLVLREDQKGRVLVTEVLLPNKAIRDLIRDDKIRQVNAEMQIDQDRLGMQTRNQSLLHHVKEEVISKETALRLSYDREELSKMIGAEVGKKAHSGGGSRAQSTLRR